MKHLFITLILLFSSMLSGVASEPSFNPLRPEKYSHIVTGTIINPHKIIIVNGLPLTNKSLSELKMSTKALSVYTGSLLVASSVKGSFKAGDNIKVTWSETIKITEKGETIISMCPHHSPTLEKSVSHKFGLLSQTIDGRYWSFEDEEL